ncbi:type I-G CRISPR-associated helicase/endonuclease Cas3g [Frigoriglobus tundricola]|uniref:CRISPR-associated helicase Cas3 n=1 Tax=Frigoriglobus tundricola TaxID=2774151 RepID=A0A6M5YLI5_9BACT|nr:CRISPR-associated helicase Cas3' [Frigoriglobus tundricola]QJW94166.1 CRISPR-associated helicase Cas3 [Frigoriglobus tundricola]
MTTWKSFVEFFQAATGGRDPYPYQSRFADASTLPHLLRAPTGAGKTATAVLGWLWRWKTKPKETPRRLVYCLPMRVLVEQSYHEAEAWLKSLELSNDICLPLPLMGGSDSGDWHLTPEKPAILIGTQDMLLSRALNRGYAATRFHWPIEFGLLNNDCLWIFDEPQLMASGVSTSAQLAGLRHSLKTFGECRSVWMSATLEPNWLDTVDFRGKFPAAPMELAATDYATPALDRRMTASKTLGRLNAAVSKDMKDVAKEVLRLHKEAGEAQTLVVLNTVDRAKAVFAALQDLRKKSELPKLLLVHSRFRPHERGELNRLLQEKGEAAKDRIIVATQVVEAGVDISARTLVTELAPWASAVQRIGRCNRTGDDGPGRVYWIDLDEEKQGMPYEVTDLTFARKQLNALDGKDVSPKALDDFKTQNKIMLPFAHKHVLRRRDLLDLFDTSPDLSGNDIDVSRFVRSDDPDTDVQVFWRAVDSTGPTADEPDEHRAELCNVPIGQARDFLSKIAEQKLSGFVWDHIDREWVKLDPRQVRPALTILLPVAAGGYHTELGWTGDTKNAVAALPPDLARAARKEATDSDSNCETPHPRTIAQHTEGVCKAVDSILGAVDALLPNGWPERLQTAARWHDVGKGHDAFQIGMRRANPGLVAGTLWAKSGVSVRLRHGRKYFRHELASALVALQSGQSFEIAYLILAHHGKARLSIRALPKEDMPDDPKTLFALGVHDGDTLPSVDLGGVTFSGIKLDLSPMQLGGDSWTARALKLLEELGPFKLAYLEALLRAADQRVSNAERRRESP